MLPPTFGPPLDCQVRGLAGYLAKLPSVLCSIHRCARRRAMRYILLAGLLLLARGCDAFWRLPCQGDGAALVYQRAGASSHGFRLKLELTSCRLLMQTPLRTLASRAVTSTPSRAAATSISMSTSRRCGRASARRAWSSRICRTIGRRHVSRDFALLPLPLPLSPLPSSFPSLLRLTPAEVHRRLQCTFTGRTVPSPASSKSACSWCVSKFCISPRPLPAQRRYRD